MAQKDILEKVLMAYSDVFADCENVLTYNGRRRLKPEELHPAPTESFYWGKEKVHNQFADVSSYLVKGGEIRIQFIIGNETALEWGQVLRKASYQGGAYRTQLESGRPVYPVVGMVIDWTRKGERIPLSLHELLRRESGPEGISEEDLMQVDDVKLKVYHMCSLSREIRDRFTSDIGFVADYLNEGSFENRRNQKIIHVEALCRMMEALTGDERFTDQVAELLKRQDAGKEIVMCEYIDMLEARGEMRGEMRGENRLANLLRILLKEKKYKEIEAVSEDQEKRQEMYERYGI